MATDFKQLVKYVVWLAGQHEKPVSETRLIKYLYLVDLYHARLKNGQTLTGWPWSFVHFGPYCPEAYSAIDEAVENGLINENYHESKYEDKAKFRLFGVDEDELDKEPPFANKLDIVITSQLLKIIKKYGDDTAQLLDYVYYDTEPMRDAHPYQKLDFNLAQKVEKLPEIKMRQISTETLKKGIGIIDKLKKSYQDAANDSLSRNRKRVSCGLYDDAFDGALEYLNGEDLETGLKGIAKVKP